MGLWVTGCDAVDLLHRMKPSVHCILRIEPFSFFSSTYPKRLQVIHGDFIPKQMQQSILEHASVTVPKQDKEKRVSSQATPIR